MIHRPHSAPPHFILTMEGELRGEDTEENRDIVRRIHACVNACEGITTEELEKGIIEDMRRVLNDVVPLLQRPATPNSFHAANAALLNSQAPLAGR